MTTSAKPTRSRKPAEPVPGYTTASEQLKQRRDEFDEALDRIAPKTTTKTDPTAPKGRAINRTRNTTETDPTPEVARPTGGICHCGCGGQTGGTYRQGHDAKHVSVLVSYVAAQTITYEDAKRELPSGALQVKFHNAWNKLVRKAEAKGGTQPRQSHRGPQREGQRDRRAEPGRELNMATKPAPRRRGRLRQLPSGRWQAGYVGPDAQVHACPTGTFSGRELAEGWIASELRLIELDAWTPPAVREAAKYAGSVTVEKYVETWIASREIRETTRRTYETTLKNHIKGPAIAEVTVKQLTRGQVTGWWQNLDKATPRARSKAYGLLRSALNAAVDEELIEMNPARVKNRKAITSSTPRKLTPIEPEQLDLLVAGIEIERYRLLVQLAAWGGLRYGELVALRRRDIDLRGDYPVVSVTRSVTFITGQPPHAGPPKTDAGERSVVLPSALKPIIAAHLLRHTQPGADGLLFPGKNGGYLWESVFHKAWNKARKAAGLPNLRIHDLRHASAVWALQTGETFSGVQARLGHSTPAAALRYQHAASGSDERIAKGLDRKLGVQGQEPTPDQATPPAEPEAQSSSAS